MSVEKQPDGRRSVRVEVEVPGTPEQVWQAIATGPGVSAWFVPTKIDGKVGGTVACDFGGGMVSGAKITEWQPPKRFVATDETWLPGGPPVATEWTVEARSGDTCVVRVVHSLFASTDDWDGQLESTEKGWPGFFRVLRTWLTDHRGQPAATMQAMAIGQDEPLAMWRTLTQALGAPDPRPGQSVRVQTDGAPALVGTIAHVDHTPSGHGLNVRLSAPAPGVALLGAFGCGGMKMATMQVYFFGAGAADAAKQQERWQQWLGGVFPQQEAGAQ
ncbi:MAG: SRPBCC domain-containing protein [Planctomycetota bacterium]